MILLRRRRFVASLAALALPLPGRAAAPDPFPAGALTDPGLWDDPEFVARWGSADPDLRLACRNWPGPCEALGAGAHGAWAFFEAGRLRSISLLFLDAGTWFGFSQAGATAKVPEFLALHRQTAETVTSALSALGGKLRDVPMGGTKSLQHTARVVRISRSASSQSR